MANASSKDSAHDENIFSLIRANIAQMIVNPTSILHVDSRLKIFVNFQEALLNKQVIALVLSCRWPIDVYFFVDYWTSIDRVSLRLYHERYRLQEGWIYRFRVSNLVSS